MDIKEKVSEETDLHDMAHHTDENTKPLMEDGSDLNGVNMSSEATDAINRIFDRAGADGDEITEFGGGDASKLNNGAASARPSYPFDITSEFGGVVPESIPDVNIYQHKKTVAQGMMDLALFSANANQLRYVLESNNHPFYYSGVVLIAISLSFQIAVGVGLLLNTRYNVKDKKEICIANKINNFTIVGIFLVTVINVFISAFGVASNGGSVAIVARSGEE